MHSLFFAIRTLTRLPVGSKPLEREERSLFWFPLVGAIFGLLGWLVALLPLPAALRAALIIASWAYLSRGFHLDGLADLADGLGGGFTAERTLEIMRDVHTGAFGTLTLIVALLVQYSALTSLVEAPLTLIFVPVISRSMLVVAASSLSYAREGSGSAQKLVAGATAKNSVTVLLQLVALGALLFYVQEGAFFVGYLLAVATALCITLVMLLIVKKRIGGVTGDVLGAIAVLSECGALIGFVLPLA